MASPEIRFFNRDLSWLKFNDRVLYQARDHRNPLLERARFLAIFSANLDEFFMKRVGYLKRVTQRNVQHVGADMMSPVALLRDVRAVVQKQNAERNEIYEKSILPELTKAGIQFLKWSDLTDGEKKLARSYFLDKVFPVLTPLAVDKSHPFPFLSNLSISLGIVLAHPKTGESLFARVKIPDVLPQWVQLNQGVSAKAGYRLIRLRDLIAANLEELFPEMLIQSITPFRVTRNADIGETSDDVEDRLDLVEEELRQRRIAQIVRLEHSATPDKTILDLLKSELELEDSELYEVPGEISYHSLQEVANLSIPELRFRPHMPAKPVGFKDDSRDVFSVIRERDVLVHHPYESFHDSVERFVREAAKDPNVLAIKITLYRTGENNPIIPMLIRAAEKGKQVVCVVELKARFDEARNIYWAEMLEDAGVHIAYGVLGKKIHTKTVLVIRKEGDSYRFYSHVGTGNYNPVTAKLYTDLSLFTADKRIGSELIEVFNFLTGLSLKKNYQKILVAPVTMRRRFLQAIKTEIEHQRSSSNGRIVAKMNSLEDPEICEALYQASQAGVKIDLIVRGFCCLVPGVKGMSENIRVFSVIGRFLEHSRIYYFGRGATDPVDGKFYIGSADWMYRNLNNRIETVVPVDDPGAKSTLWRILNTILEDQVQTWELSSSGEYALKKSAKGDTGIQEKLIATIGGHNAG